MDAKTVVECFNDDWLQVRDERANLIGFVHTTLSEGQRIAMRIGKFPVRFLALPCIVCEEGMKPQELPGFHPANTPVVDLGPDPKTKADAVAQEQEGE